MENEEIKDKLSEYELRNIIFSNNDEVRKQYCDVFSSEIEKVIQYIYSAYDAYKKIENTFKREPRGSYVVAFLFNSIHSLIDSVSLLISGYLIPSGNLVRHSIESLAMAILISNKQLDVFGKFATDPDKFRTNQSLSLIESNKSKFNINTNGWAKFKEMRDFFHMHSHPSGLSLLNFMRKTSSGWVVKFGADYDPKKKEIYLKEIQGRIMVAKYISNIVEGIEKGIL
jgi:hypothetical protein